MLTIIVQLGSQITPSDHLSVKLVHGEAAATRTDEADRSRTEERLGFGVSVELDGMDGGYLRAYFL